LAEIRRDFRRMANRVHQEDHFGKRRGLLTQMEALYTEAVGETERAEVEVSIHPGLFLQDRYMVPQGLTVADVAGRIRMAEGRVKQLVEGQRRLEPDVAIRLGLLTGTPARMWMRMQAAVDLQNAMGKMEGLKAQVTPLD
jgi:addiction module HigA family antidote